MHPDSHDALLLVEAAGRPWAIELGLVAEVRGIDAEQVGSAGTPVLNRNGVAVPVYTLGHSADMTARGSPGALVVLDLPQRIAALRVDAVCEVRIAPARRPAPAAPEIRRALPPVQCIASWESGEAPVLDVTSWVAALEGDAAETPAH